MISYDLIRIHQCTNDYCREENILASIVCFILYIIALNLCDCNHVFIFFSFCWAKIISSGYFRPTGVSNDIVNHIKYFKKNLNNLKNDVYFFMKRKIGKFVCFIFFFNKILHMIVSKWTDCHYWSNGHSSVLKTQWTMMKIVNLFHLNLCFLCAICHHNYQLVSNLNMKIDFLTLNHIWLGFHHWYTSQWYTTGQNKWKQK